MLLNIILLNGIQCQASAISRSIIQTIPQRTIIPAFFRTVEPRSGCEVRP